MFLGFNTPTQLVFPQIIFKQFKVVLNFATICAKMYQIVILLKYVGIFYILHTGVDFIINI